MRLLVNPLRFNQS